MLFHIAVLCLLVAYHSCFGTATILAQSSNVLSTAKLQALILESQSKIKSIYFDYRGSDAYAGNSQFPEGTYLRRIVAAKSPNLFSHETAKGTDNLAWEKDPRRRHCIVENGQFFDIWVTNRAYSSTTQWAPDAPLPGSMPGEQVFLVTGIWPMMDRRPPEREGNPYMLRNVAISDRFSVRPKLESVAGVWCHVLENPRVDILWIDVNRGCALLARNFYDLKTKELLARFELSGHNEVKPGIWLPSTFRILAYDTKKKSQVVQDRSFQISIARANDVPDSMFVCSLQPGALWLNPPKEESLNAIQTRPGGTDHLDNLVAWAKPVLPDKPSAERPVPWLAWASAGFAGLGTFFLIELIVHASPTEVSDSSGGQS